MNTTGRGVLLRVLMLCAALFALAIPATASAQGTITSFGVHRTQSAPFGTPAGALAPIIGQGSLGGGLVGGVGPGRDPGVVFSPLDYPTDRFPLIGLLGCGVDNPAIAACPRFVDGTNEHSAGAFPGLLQSVAFP